MLTGTNDVEGIYRQMAGIRRDPHTNVSESVAGAETVMDWGRYAWLYPWIGMGAAGAVGYLIYTSGRPSPNVAANAASVANGVISSEPTTDAAANRPERSKAGPKLLLAAWDILLPVAVRAGQNYMLHWLEQHYPTRAAHRTDVSPMAEEGGGRIGQAQR